MKKLLVVLVGMFLLCYGVVFANEESEEKNKSYAIASIGENLIPNHSFEERSVTKFKGYLGELPLPAGWLFSKPGGGKPDGIFLWDNTTSHTGKYSVKIAELKGYGYWTISGRGIVINGGKEYHLSAWIKTEEATGATFLQPVFFDVEHKILMSEVKTGEKLTGTNDWTKVSLTFTCPEEAVYVRIDLRSSNNNGAVWFDDVSLTSEERLVLNIIHLAFEDGDVYPAFKIAGDLRIDGDLEDWKGKISPSFKLSDESHIGKSCRKNWKGADDLSTSFSACYDEKYLYLAFKVKDDIFHQTKSGTDMWKEDCIQLCFNPQNEPTKGFDINDYRYGFALCGGKNEVYAWNMAHEHKQDLRSIKLAVIREDKKTNYEMAIPWENIQPFQLKDGSYMGFTFIVNDSDRKAGDYKYLEWMRGVGTRTPKNWGSLFFASSRDEDEIIAKLILEDESFSKEEAKGFRLKLVNLKGRGAEIELSLNEKSLFKESVKLKKGHTILEIPPVRMKGKLREGDNEVNAIILVEGKEVKIKKSFFCYSSTEMLARIPDMEKQLLIKIGSLKELINLAGEMGIDTTLPETSLTVAECFSIWARADLERREKVAEWKEMDSILVIHKELKDSLIIAEKAIKETKELLKHPDKALSFRKPSIKNLQLRDGSFWNEEGEPIFLFGYNCMDWGDVPSPWEGAGVKTWEEALKIFKKLGCNLCRIVYGHSKFRGKRWYRNSWPVIERKADIAWRNNFVSDISVCVTSYLFPPSYLKKHPELKRIKGNHHFIYDPDDPATRKALSYIYGNIKPRPGILFYYLDGEPAFTSYTAHTEKKYQEWLKTQYSSIKQLNQLWGTGFKDFSKVSVHPIGNNKARQYDWYAFNQYRVTNLYRWMKETIKKRDPDGLCHVMIQANREFSFSHICRPLPEHGISMEDIAELSNVQGHDLGVSQLFSGEYSMCWQTQSIALDLMKSLSPEKIIYDGEWHSIPNSPHDYTPEYVRTALWLNFLHGTRANLVWQWARYRPLLSRPHLEIQRLPASLTAKPLLLESYARASWELQRLAKYVVPFARAKKRIKIFRSRPSYFLAPYDHLHCLQNVYEGLYFLGKPIGFTTAKQIIRGGLKDCELLIIPRACYEKEDTVNAIKRYLKKGGRIVVVGEDSLRFTERGQERQLGSLWQMKGVKLITHDLKPKEYNKILREEIENIGITSPVRIVDDIGQSPWGVEWKVVKTTTGKWLIYMVNLNNQEVKLRLVSSESITRIRDIVREEMFPIDKRNKDFNLKPLDFIFFELE